MAAISTTYDSYVYGVDTSSYASSSSSSGSGEFDAILASQMSDESSTSTTTSTSSAEQVLASYDSGQQAAYALSQQSEETSSSDEAAATGETASTSGTTAASESAAASEAAATAAASEETASGDESAGVGDTGEVGDTEEVDEEEETLVASGAGWPGDGTYMAEWNPSGMQFYDELTGQWIDDNIPHRINENGDMEYNWEGNWYLDTATRHRMMVDGEYVEVGGEGAGDGSTQTASAATTLDESGPFAPEYYYNTDLGQWKLFNFPTRDSEGGGQEYYWQDQWWTDNWDHNYAAASTEQTGSTTDQAADSSMQTQETDEKVAA